MFKMLANKWVITLLAAAAVGGIIYLNSGDGGLDADTAEAQIRDLEQIVSATGTVKAPQEINLAFEVSGRVTNIFVNLAEEVARGQRLISLDMGELLAQLNEAEANFEVQRAKLDEFNRGTRVEEINISAAKAQSSESALADAKENFVNITKDAYTKAPKMLTLKPMMPSGIKLTNFLTTREAPTRNFLSSRTMPS